jgi:hypothetical protein
LPALNYRGLCGVVAPFLVDDRRTLCVRRRGLATEQRRLPFGSGDQRAEQVKGLVEAALALKLSRLGKPLPQWPTCEEHALTSDRARLHTSRIAVPRSVARIAAT